ncbi:MAG: hypothetical protein JWM44_4141 [Bacilli bacterium]|nr:hypothetical protein [Bacilli bacterium]
MSQQRRIRLIAAMLCCVILSVGCGNKAQTEGKTKAYANDGYLGTTAANPNDPTNPTFHTYAMDASMVKSTLRKINGIDNASVIFKGPHLYVYLDLNKDIDLESAMRIKQEARDAVSAMMPRYQVKVTTGKNKLPSRG